MRKLISVVQCDYFDCEAKEERQSVLEAPFKPTDAALPSSVELPYAWTSITVYRTGPDMFSAKVTFCPEHSKLYERTLAAMVEATEPLPGYNS